MTQDRVVLGAVFFAACAGLLASESLAAGRPLYVGSVPCNEDFLLDNIHYVQGSDGVTGCAGDVVIGYNSRRTLDVLAVRFDTIESANLVDGTLYLNGKGSLRLSDPVTPGPSRVVHFKRVTLMIRGDSSAGDDQAGPMTFGAPQQNSTPRLQPIRASWSKPVGQGRVRQLSMPRISQPRKTRSGPASPNSLRGCLELATQLKDAEDPVGGVRISNLNDYSTGRFAVVQYGKQTGAAVILNRSGDMSPGAGLTCLPD
ncbi:MAG TPA: hypothetical protein DCM05_15825 [Elusimicrobia bacterium]|nr:hypothetical protein [Elusimicrobiota bacterium]